MKINNLTRIMQKTPALSAFFLLFSANIQAQDAGALGLSTEQGHGVKLGRDAFTKLHLMLDAGIGYNTNPYSLQYNNPALVGDMVLKLRPGIGLSVDSEKVFMNLNLSFEWGALPDIGHNGKNPSFLLFQGNANADAEFNRNGGVSLYVNDEFNATRKPNVLFTGNNLQLNNTVIAGINMRPGGLATISVDGQYGINYWPSKASAGAWGDDNAGAFNSDNFYGHARFDWKALAKASLYLDARGGLFNYRGDRQVVATPLWTQIGITGNLSPKFRTTIGVGYANPFVRKANYALLPANYLGVTFVANGKWQMAQRSSMEFGFSRDMAPVPTYLDVTPLSGKLAFQQWIGEVVTIDLGVGSSYYYFGHTLADRGSNMLHRQDITGSGNVGLTWHAKKWLSLGLTNTTDLRWSNSDTLLVTATDTGSTNKSGAFKYQYLRNETMLLLGVNY